MSRFEWDCATVIILGIVTAIYFGIQDTNTKYYASMDKCTAASGTFIPTSQGNAICMMGNK